MTIAIHDLGETLANRFNRATRSLSLSLVLIMTVGNIAVFAQSKPTSVGAAKPPITLNDSHLKSVFEYDFRERKLDDNRFSLQRNDLKNLVPTPSGLKVFKTESHIKQFTISPRFSLHGDFDIVASFTGLVNGAGTKDCGVYFSVAVDDEDGHVVRLQRSRNQQQLQLIRGQLTVPGEIARRVVSDATVRCESMSGHLRITRKGDQIQTLFAESDATPFQVIGTDLVSDRDVKVEGIVMGITNGDGNHVEVIWSRLRMQAERMMYYPTSDPYAQKLLRKLDIESGKITDVAANEPPYLRVGSPKWSADRTKIAFDTTSTSTVDAHVMVVDADGTNRIDLGLGCLPSFSPDGEFVAFSSPNFGVGIMNVDGTNRRLIDASGWSGQWSPDGQWIAYTLGGNIAIYDVETGGRRLLLARSCRVSLQHNLLEFQLVARQSVDRLQGTSTRWQHRRNRRV